MNRITALLTMVTLAVGLGIQPALAKDNSFHEDSEHYRVYIGIVPASFLEKKPSLIDQDKQLHGGISEQPSTTQHVMVTVFRKNNNTRVLNATAIAKVSRDKVFRGSMIEKPLEKMVTSGAVAYANFFDMPERGKYRIEVKIYESQKNGYETVHFAYEKN